MTTISGLNDYFSCTVKPLYGNLGMPLSDLSSRSKSLHVYHELFCVEALLGTEGKRQKRQATFTWLRGFRAKIAKFSRPHCLAFSRRGLSTKKTKGNIEKWPESLGVMLALLIYRTWAYRSFWIFVLLIKISKTITLWLHLQHNVW